MNTLGSRGIIWIHLVICGLSWTHVVSLEGGRVGGCQVDLFEPDEVVDPLSLRELTRNKNAILS